jgi:hypothetical protein
VEDVNENQKRKVIEQAWNLDEQTATASSDMLTESCARSEAEFHVHGTSTRSKSMDHLHRFRPKTAAGNLRVSVKPVDHFKGLGPDETLLYRQWQKEQIQTKEVRQSSRKQVPPILH